MKRKLITVALVTFLICVVLGNIVACEIPNEIPEGYWLMAGVPDTNPPLTEKLSTTNNDTTNYCAPMAMVNVLKYWDDVEVHPNAQNVTAGLPANETAEYIGYFMDTNNNGSADRGNLVAHKGTYAKDISPGTNEIVSWNTTNKFRTPLPHLPAGKIGYVWNLTDDWRIGLDFCIKEIDAERPLAVCFRYWNPIYTDVSFDEPLGIEDDIYVYKWGPRTNISEDTNPEEEWNWDYPAPLDHFKCYKVDSVPVEKYVYLEDQFGAVEARVGESWYFCNPVEKLHDEVSTEILDYNHHLTVYTLYYEGEPQTRQVGVANQFGTQQLTVSGPVGLAVPTHKLYPEDDHEPPVGLDHFLLYDVIEGPYVDVEIDLNDQFGYEEWVEVGYPLYFANPVLKEDGGEVTEIENPEAHLVFYGIQGGSFNGQVVVDNQFGEQTLDVSDPALLAVPSLRIGDEYCIGHAVTAVGYFLDVDLDGSGRKDYVIVHDNWPTTQKNVAIPWAYWNSSHAVDPGPQE